MNIKKLKNDWESLAKRDALGAILTDDSKAGGKWDTQEFMTTGKVEVNAVFDHLARIGYHPDFNGAALDFGCGVGRLTQPLAAQFASCTGLDISQEMIARAIRLNSLPGCSFLANSSTVLPFSDGSFSFIYSNIVLQHVPRHFAMEYLREFVRVLAPGGLLVFGVQDKFATPDIASRIVRIRHVLRLRSRLQEALGRGKGNMQMHCLPETEVRKALGAARIVDVQWTNTAARDFNGKLAYLEHPPPSGYIGKQYCVFKEP
jgi:SAM-dependent methyltransferase